MRRASAIRQLTAARNAPRLAAAFVEHTVQIWDLDKCQRLSEFESVFAFGGDRVTLSSDGNICVAAGWTKGKRGGVAAYDVLTGSPIWHRADIRQTQFVRFSCAGDIVGCGAEAGRFQLLDARTGATVNTLTGVKKTFDSPFSNLLLLETRNRGFRIKGSRDLSIPRETFALLHVAFSPDAICLSESGGPVRCLDCHSGFEQWRYNPPSNTHVLRLGFRSADLCFYGVQWEYERGTSRTLFRFGHGSERYEEICHLQSLDEDFFSDADALITSDGNVISVATGEIVRRLAFPQKDYPDPIV